MNRALLDTDIDSEILKGINPAVRNNAIAYRTHHGILTLSAVTLMEIAQGHHQKQATRQLQRFLDSVAAEEVLPFDRSWPAGSRESSNASANLSARPTR